MSDEARLVVVAYLVRVDRAPNPTKGMDI